MSYVKNHLSAGNDLQTVLLLSSAFLCFFSIFGLASSDTVTVLTLSHLVSFLLFFEVIPEFCSNFAFSRFGLGITFPSRLIGNAVKIGDSTCCCEFQPPTGQLRALFATGYIAGKALRRKRVRRPALTIRIYTRGFRVEIVQDSLRRAIFPCISSVPSRVSSEQD